MLAVEKELWYHALTSASFTPPEILNLLVMFVVFVT